MGGNTNGIVDRVCGDATVSGVRWLGHTPERPAELLEAMADALEARRTDILKLANEQSALTVEELTPEFARMTGTLRMFAGVVRERTWVRAAKDAPAAHPQAAIGPNHDVRRMLIPLGPVAVFGASNFPLAYGVCGGDTASALAAGCPVVVKEHPAHPRLGRMLHEIASRAVAGSDGVLGYINNENPRDLAIAQQIVQHPSISGVGFTGSVGAGLALEALARARAEPIPVFAEMGSCNPIYVTARAASRRGTATADQFADSILMRHGQQCTKAGLIFVEELKAAGAHLRDQLVARFAAAKGRDMLAPWVKASYLARVKECEAVEGVEQLARGGDKPGDRGSHAALFATDLETWRSAPKLHDEVFGPATILIDTPAGKLGPPPEMLGHLVCSWYMETEDYSQDAPYHQLPSVGARAGRVVFNGVPTGVRVSAGMVHGGPYPSSNRPDTTAVGPMAIERWCCPVCFQNFPTELLPQEMR